MVETRTGSFLKIKLDMIWERTILICENTSFHGMKYIVSQDNRWYFKFFWIIVITMCVGGLYRILTATITSLKEQSISFTLETTYLGWNTTFPAVTLCEKPNNQNLWSIARQVYGNNISSGMVEYIGDISFFSGTCYSCESLYSRNLIEYVGNFTEVIEMFRSSCDDLIIECFWNRISFDCCSTFLPLETEFGMCYSFNSLNSQMTTAFAMKISNEKQGAGLLQIRSARDVKVFIHPPEDVPIINGDLDMMAAVSIGSEASVNLNVIEVTNDPDVEQTSPEIRQCRFPSEQPLNLKAYSIYSYSTCIVQCHIDAQIRLCNCTHHLMPSVFSDYFCDIAGLRCLTDHYDILTSLKTKDSNKPGLICNCQPACNEPEYSLVEFYTHELRDGGNQSRASVLLTALPTLRYNRKVMRTGLDLMVAIGSGFGLFFGASVLSIAEIVYFIFFRKWK